MIENQIEVTEITIKVSFGHVAGKWWGPKSVRPIILLHGWQDNAGSFDHLIPMLPKHLSYLALDFPGHGRSSRFPDGCLYSITNYLYLLRYIFKVHFNWSYVSLLSHSMGATISFLYASTFSDVDMVIAIDGIKAPSIQMQYIRYFMDGINNDFFYADLQNQQKEQPVARPYNETIDRIVWGTMNSVSKNAASCLLERGAKEIVLKDSKSLYSITRDNRLKVFFFDLFPSEIYRELAKSVSCPYLFIKTPFLRKFDYSDDEQCKIMGRNKNFKVFDVVETSHHVHLNEPQKVAGKISEFLNKHRSISKIRSNL